MIRNSLFIFISFTVLFYTLECQATSKWLHSSEFGRIHIVLNPDPTLSEEKAAEWFQQHWHTMTGHLIAISSQPEPNNVSIWIGPNQNPHVNPDKLESLGDDGFIIRTISESNVKNNNGTLEDRHLILAGGRQRGSLYAVWQFFETIMGMRWLAPNSFHVPLPPHFIPKTKIEKVPDFWYRDISYRSYDSTPWLNASGKTNGFYSGTPKDWGGHIRYFRGLEGHGHTFHHFVPPDEYFDEHPEYFAEIGGVRRADGQLCLTNSDVLDITTQKVRELLESGDENEKIVSVSQMDFFWFDSWCTCTNCAAVDHEEKSHAGTIIRFVNQIARSIKEDYPDAFIDTFAYHYSRNPPAHVKPENNVIVRLCDFEVDFSRPINDRAIPENRAFLKDLKQWSRITKNLFIWDYTQNWYSHQGPHPNVHVLQPNIALFAKHGVSGVFEQASWESPHSDFEFLKGYILAHSLWEPGGDWQKWYDEFLAYYYREAAPFIDEYLNLIRNRTFGEGVFLHMANRMEWMDYDMVVRAQHIFRRAFEHVNDDEILERLRYAFIPVQYAALVCPPKVTPKTDAYIFERPPSQSFGEYWNMIRGYGVTRLEDWPIERFGQRLNATTPPRYERHPFTTFSSPNSTIQVVPTLGGKITRLTQGKKEWLRGHLTPQKSAQTLQLYVGDEDGSMIPVEKPFAVVSESETSITLQSEIQSQWLMTLRYWFDFEKNSLNCTATFLNQSKFDSSPAIRIEIDLATPSRKRPVLFDHTQRALRLKRQPTYTFDGRAPWRIRDRNHSLGFDAGSSPATMVEVNDDADRSTTSVSWTPVFGKVPVGGQVQWRLSIEL
jgi:hypothetical protein